MARETTTQTLIEGEVPSIHAYQYQVQNCDYAESVHSDTEDDRQTKALLFARAIQAALNQSGESIMSPKGDILEN